MCSSAPRPEPPACPSQTALPLHLSKVFIVVKHTGVWLAGSVRLTFARCHPGVPSKAACFVPSRAGSENSLGGWKCPPAGPGGACSAGVGAPRSRPSARHPTPSAFPRTTPARSLTFRCTCLDPGCGAKLPGFPSCPTTKLLWKLSRVH